MRILSGVWSWTSSGISKLRALNEAEIWTRYKGNNKGNKAEKNALNQFQCSVKNLK